MINDQHVDAYLVPIDVISGRPEWWVLDPSMMTASGRAVIVTPHKQQP